MTCHECGHGIAILCVDCAQKTGAGAEAEQLAELLCAWHHAQKAFEDAMTIRGWPEFWGASDPLTMLAEEVDQARTACHEALTRWEITHGG